jgi:hypothetical protein
MKFGRQFPFFRHWWGELTRTWWARELIVVFSQLYESGVVIQMSHGRWKWMSPVKFFFPVCSTQLNTFGGFDNLTSSATWSIPWSPRKDDSDPDKSFHRQDFPDAPQARKLFSYRWSEFRILTWLTVNMGICTTKTRKRMETVDSRPWKLPWFFLKFAKMGYWYR